MLEVWEKYGRLQKMLREKDADIYANNARHPLLSNASIEYWVFINSSWNFRKLLETEDMKTQWIPTLR